MSVPLVDIAINSGGHFPCNGDQLMADIVVLCHILTRENMARYRKSLRSALVLLTLQPR